MIGLNFRSCVQSLLENRDHLRLYQDGTELNVWLDRAASYLVSYVRDRPWWPLQSPNNGRAKQAKG